jgi:hypothetical protein
LINLITKMTESPQNGLISGKHLKGN